MGHPGLVNCQLWTVIRGLSPVDYSLYRTKESRNCGRAGCQNALESSVKWAGFTQQWRSGGSTSGGECRCSEGPADEESDSPA